MVQRVLTFLFLILLPFSVQSQITEHIEKITFTENADSIPRFNRDGRHFTFFDEKNNYLIFIEGQSFWRLELDSFEWQKITELTIPNYLTDAFLDTLNNRLVFISGGVGEVHTLDLKTDKYELKRVDQSFRHLNQFGSTKFMDHTSGKIYAFGGYGFWYFKNYISSYNSDISEWNLVPLENPESTPDERSGALGIFSSINNKFFMLGGYGVPGGRQKESGVNTINYKDFWSFDFNSFSWNNLGQLNTTIIINSDNFDGSGFISQNSYNTIDEDKSFWFFSAINPETKLRNQFLIVDLKTPGIATFELKSDLNFGLDEIFGLFWDNKSKKLIAFGNTRISQGQYFPLSLYKISLKDSSSISKYINENNILVSSKLSSLPAFISITTRNFWLVILSILSITFLFLASIYLFTSSKQQNNLVKSESILLVKNLEDPKPEIFFNGKLLNHHLGEKHIELLTLLIQNKLNGKHYLSSDIIDENIWSYKMNQDYLRKERASKISDLNNFIKLSSTTYQKLIVRRKSPDDKRRSEYGLNPHILIQNSKKLVLKSKSQT